MKKIQIITTIILLISLSSFFPLVSTANQTTTNTPPQSLIPTEFSSNIDLDYDAILLNEELEIDITVSIPLTITYQTNIPSTFLRFFPWQIRNIILFGTLTYPMQEIHLELIDSPSSAIINLSKENILVNIPYDGSPIEAQTTLTITPLQTISAEPTSFKIKASCEQIGKINGAETIETITFNPCWISKLNITINNPIITATAGSLTHTKIMVKNEGNQDSLITAKIRDDLADWGLCLSPSFMMVSQNEIATFDLHVGIPLTCSNCYRSFEIEFTSTNLNKNMTFGSRSVYLIIQGVDP